MQALHLACMCYVIYVFAVTRATLKRDLEVCSCASLGKELDSTYCLIMQLRANTAVGQSDNGDTPTGCGT